MLYGNYTHVLSHKVAALDLKYTFAASLYEFKYEFKYMSLNI